LAAHLGEGGTVRGGRRYRLVAGVQRAALAQRRAAGRGGRGDHRQGGEWELADFRAPGAAVSGGAERRRGGSVGLKRRLGTASGGPASSPGGSRDGLTDQRVTLSDHP